MTRSLLHGVSIIARIIACGMALSGVAAAKVKSITIESIYKPYDSRYVMRDLSHIITRPLVMESLKGNPTVTYRIYIADGEESDYGRFELLTTSQRIFAHYEIINGILIGWRLDTSKGEVGFGSSLRTVLPGVHSFYVTADDGDGESPPSNIISDEMMPYADQVFEKPLITDIRSPAAGIVVFRLQPLVYLGKGDPKRYIRVYRADGTELDYEKFKAVGSRFGAGSMEDTSSVKEERVNEVVVMGLKSGPTSIFAQVRLEWGEWVRGISSNILMVDVAGTSRSDESMSMYMSPVVTAGLRDDLPVGDAARLWPNPADRVTYLRVASDGEARVRIFTMLGDQVAAQRVEVVGGIGAIDLSALAAGRYVAVIESRAGTSHAPLVVVR